MTEGPDSGVGLRGATVERHVVGAWRFIPRLLNTYYAVLVSPRRYFRQLRRPTHESGTVSPATFWVTNVLLCRVIDCLMRKSAHAGVGVKDVSDLAGLAIGTGLFAAFLTLILGIRGWRGFRQALRVVFSGAVFFVPLHLASVTPFPPNMLEDLAAPGLLGTKAGIPWGTLAVPGSYVVLVLGWFVWIGLGMRYVFPSRSKASIALCLTAVPAFLIMFCVIWVVVAVALAVFKQIPVTKQGFALARTALLQTPPDYFAAGRAFDAVYSCESKFIRRADRVRGRVGAAAASLASLAVQAECFDIEKQLYRAQTEALSGDTDAGASLLFDAAEQLQKQERARKTLLGSPDKDLADLKRMMADKSYTPWTKSEQPTKWTGLGIPTPSVFP